MIFFKMGNEVGFPWNLRSLCGDAYFLAVELFSS